MMKLRMGSTLMLAMAFGCQGEAPDGGSILWRGKGASDDVKTIMAEANKEGRAMMMFFTSKG